MTTKMIPATIAANPAQRMRFEAVMLHVALLDRRILPIGVHVVVSVSLKHRDPCHGLTSGPSAWCGFNLNDRDQWQAEITHFP